MARSWLPLDPDSAPRGLPLFQRIAECIVREVERGRLLAGEELPSSRALAELVGVHRNTVVAAYAELVAQGYAETKPARGTFLRRELPTRALLTASRARRDPVPLNLAPLRPWSPFAPLPRGHLALLGGVPDLRPFPREAWARALRKASRDGKRVLEYGSERGHPRFLATLRRYLAATRGVVASEDEILATRGSQQALLLAGLALAGPGDAIVVERLGYRPAWEAFHFSGARLVSVDTDESGLRTDQLEIVAREGGVRVVYLTPHHQYPTTRTLTPARRMEVLRLAERYRFVVVEDDYDHEFHFEGRPILPMHARDEAGLVLHVGTFSKVLAPGLRLGYAVGRAEIIQRMTAARTYVDRQGDFTHELALATFIEEGEFSAHVRRMHRQYSERRSYFLDALRDRFAGVLSFEEPRGGLSVWARSERDVDAWAESAAKVGLVVHPGSRFDFSGRREPYLRLGFAPHTPPELARALERLERSLPPEKRRRPKSSVSLKRAAALD